MSFLKKGAGRFKPKVQPRPLRRKAAENAASAASTAGSATGVPSPPSTQTAEDDTSFGSERLEEVGEDEAVKESAISDELEDPKLTLRWDKTIPEEALEDVEEDTDAEGPAPLQQPPTPVASQTTGFPRRRTSSSTVQHLRLSGITPPIFRTRSSSISQTVAFSRTHDSTKKSEEREERTPVPIDIPVSGKRRRSLVKNPPYKRPSVRKESLAIAESEPQTEKSSANSTRNSLRQSTPIAIPKPIAATAEPTSVEVTKPTATPIRTPVTISEVTSETPASVQSTHIRVPMDNTDGLVSANNINTSSITLEHPITGTNEVSYHDRETPVEILHRFPKGTKFIMGLASNNSNEKLQKYRFSFGAEKDEKIYTAEELLIPICPETVVTEISAQKQLPRGVKYEDTEMFSHISIDIASFRMADLCKPSFPIGEVSANFEMAHIAKKKRKDARDKRRLDRARAKENMVSLEAADELESATARLRRIKAELEVEEDEEEENDSNHVSNGIQLQLTSDGKLAVDEDSTVVKRHKLSNLKNKTREEANPFENPVISLTYSKRSHTDKWTSKEEEEFYRAILTWGTDFTFIAQLFPYRNRKQIKAKFNLEERRNPEIIEMALHRRLPANFEDYSRGIKVESQASDTGFIIRSSADKETTDAEKTPTPQTDTTSNDKDNEKEMEMENTEVAKKTPLDIFNEEVRRLRQQHKEHMALIAREREKAIKEDAEASRLREIEVRTGGTKLLSRLRKTDSLRKNEEVMGSIDDVKRQRDAEAEDDE